MTHLVSCKTNFRQTINLLHDLGVEVIHDYQKCFTIKNRYLTFLFNGLRCWTLLSVTTSFIVSPSSAMFTASLSSETFSSSSTTALGALAPSDSSPFACCKKICSCSYLFAARDRWCELITLSNRNNTNSHFLGHLLTLHDPL